MSRVHLRTLGQVAWSFPLIVLPGRELSALADQMNTLPGRRPAVCAVANTPWNLPTRSCNSRV